MSKIRRRFTLIAFCLAVISIAIIAFWYFAIHIPTPTSEAEFKSQWQAVPQSDRKHLLAWVLNAEPARYQVYKVDETRFSGMSVEDVEELMGTPDRLDSPSLTVDAVQEEWGDFTIYSYEVGMLDQNLIGSFIVPWMDSLIIFFDKDGSVVRVEINE